MYIHADKFLQGRIDFNADMDWINAKVRSRTMDRPSPGFRSENHIQKTWLRPVIITPVGTRGDMHGKCGICFRILQNTFFYTAFCPCEISSPGWNNSLTGPFNSDSCSFRIVAAPRRIAVCKSCPQACICLVLLKKIQVRFPH